METKTKSNGTPPARPKNPPYMNKDQMHHVMAVMWSAIVDLIPIIEDGCVLTDEQADKLKIMKKVFGKPQNQKQ